MLLDGLSCYDELRSGAVLVAFAGLLVGERFTKRVEWLRAEFALNVVAGLLLLAYPQGVLIHISSFKADFLNLFLLRMIGNMFLAKAARHWFTVDPDDNVRSAWLMSNFVGGTAVLLIMWKHHVTDKEFLPQHASLVMLIVGARLFTAIYHLFSSADFSHSRRATPGSRLTKHFLLDILLMTISSAELLGIPQVMSLFMDTKDLKITGLHGYTQSVTGCFILSGLIYEMLALRFADDDHKRAIFKSHIVLIFLRLPWQFYYQKNYDMLSQKMFIWQILIDFAYLVNCILGALYTGKTKRV